MKPWLLVAVALTSCNSPNGGSPSATASVALGREEDDAAIRSALASYLEQGIAKKGAAVANLVTESTFTFYEQMRDAALSEPAADVRRRSLTEQMMILGMRRDLPLDKLHEGSGRDLLIHYIDTAGLADDANKNQITSIRFVGPDEAMASMIFRGKSAPDALRAMREGGSWKIDPNSLTQTANRFIRNGIEAGEMSEKQALQMMLGEDDEAAVQRLFVPVVGR